MSCLQAYDPLPPPTHPLTRLEALCLGLDLDPSRWREVWTLENPSCIQFFEDKIYGLNREFDPRGFAEVVADFNYIWGRHLNETKNFQTDPFTTVLLNACSELPGVCQQLASQVCRECSRQDISSGIALRLCGCTAPPLDPLIYPGVSRECDPLCVPAMVSKQRNPSTGAVDQCTATVCVIDNVSLRIAESTVGGVEFTQVCPQCTPSPDGIPQCRCIIDATLPDVASRVGLDNPVLFRQYCGESGLCLQIDPQTRQSIPVPCADTLHPQPRTYSFPIPWWVWVIVVVVLIVAVLAILAYRSSILILANEPLR